MNELRETFHIWVRTVVFPVRHGQIEEPLPHLPARDLFRGSETTDPVDHERARELLEETEAGLRRWLKRWRRNLTKVLRHQLSAGLEDAIRSESERYQERFGELSALIQQTTLERLEREIKQLRVRTQQGELFDEASQLAELERSIKEREEEIKRRQHHHTDLRDQLQSERARIVDRVLPARHELAGDAHVLPVAVEVRLPKRGRRNCV